MTEELLQQKNKRASGAGVKPKDGVSPMDRKQVRLDPSTDALLSRIGGGNLSLGVREAARRLAEHGDIAPFSLERHKKRSKEGL